MKKIEAIVRTSRLQSIVDRLFMIGINGMTVAEAHGMSASTVTSSYAHGQRLTTATAPRYQVMLVVKDDDAAHVVSAIGLTARTDAAGDGLVTVSNVLGVVRIRTGETDDEAI